MGDISELGDISKLGDIPKDPETILSNRSISMVSAICYMTVLSHGRREFQIATALIFLLKKKRSLSLRTPNKKEKLYLVGKERSFPTKKATSQQRAKEPGG